MQSTRFAVVLCLYIQYSWSCTRRQDGSAFVADCHRKLLNEIPRDVLALTTHIIFYGNRLSNITYNATLSRFFNLKVLNVSDNYLSQDSFKSDAFANVKTLTTLDLQGNRITAVSSPFIRNAQLRLLKMDYNKIHHIAADFLVNLPRLEELTLSHCQIQTISGQAFRSIGTNLRRLDISNNALETLSMDLRADIFSDALLSVKLHHNFWNCDCRIRWLREEVDSTSASWYFQGYDFVPHCEEPKSLKHKSWFTATSGLYGCAPRLVNAQNGITAMIGERVLLNCSVQTSIKPDTVQWLRNNISVDYWTSLTTSQGYDGTLLTTTLTINSLTDADYGLYICNVSSAFGWVVQVSKVSPPPTAPLLTPSNTGLVVAIVIASAVVVIAVALVIAFYLKKNLFHRGKLYMDAISEMSQKSEMEMLQRPRAGDGDDVTVTTPLNMSIVMAEDNSRDQPDLIKCYAEDDLESLPADTEYPIDDAGCAEYNQYLQAVSTNHSPVYVEPVNGDSAYIETVPPNHGEVYMNPPPLSYIVDGNQVDSASPVHSDQSYSDHSSNHNAPLINMPNPIVPYMETPTSVVSDPSDSLTDVVVVNRMNTTPSGSPLTFIKEEPDEESAADLL